MDTKIEDSNLAHIGSDEDKAAREAAAKLEVDWEGAGEKEGINIWRVENKRDENDNPDFGINKWPEKWYGHFYRGDSYIVLKTYKDEDGSGFLYDIFFWIGSGSSQDEYAVAAYKANELDDLFGDAPVQYREVEGYESTEFMECFSRGVHYHEGGMDSGFRDVKEDEGFLELPTELAQIRKQGRLVRSFQVPLSCESLNEGDAFFLDTGKNIYTWYGEECSPFERSHAAEMAHNLASTRYGHCTVEVDVEDDNEEFWSLLGGKGDIKPASAFQADDIPDEEPSMFKITETEDRTMHVTDLPATSDNLDSNDVLIVDTGRKVYVWIGKDSSKREQSQAMVMVERHLKSASRCKTTSVRRVIQGREKRCRGFQKALGL